MVIPPAHCDTSMMHKEDMFFEWLSDSELDIEYLN
jgi:hypothetical protein